MQDVHGLFRTVREACSRWLGVEPLGVVTEPAAVLLARLWASFGWVGRRATGWVNVWAGRWVGRWVGTWTQAGAVQVGKCPWVGEWHQLALKMEFGNKRTMDGLLDLAPEVIGSVPLRLPGGSSLAASTGGSSPSSKCDAIAQSLSARVYC